MLKKAKKNKSKHKVKLKAKALCTSKTATKTPDKCLGCWTDLGSDAQGPWCEKCYHRSMREFLYGNTCLYVGND